MYYLLSWNNLNHNKKKPQTTIKLLEIKLKYSFKDSHRLTKPIIIVKNKNSLTFPKCPLFNKLCQLQIDILYQLLKILTGKEILKKVTNQKNKKITDSISVIAR